MIATRMAGRSARRSDAPEQPPVASRSQHEHRVRTMTTIKLFTRKAIAERDSKNETVFIIDNLVYDVSKFLDEHPGGHEVLVNQAGKDASEEFDDVGHSLDAKELMAKYVIGELVEEDRVHTQKRQVSWEDSRSEADAGFISSWKFPVLLGIVVTVLYTYLFG